MQLKSTFGILGIDYSMSCPAACWHPHDTRWSHENCTWIFLTKQKKFSGYFLDGRIRGFLIPEEFSCEQERYNTISKEFINLSAHVQNIGLEGYSMGSSSGMVFNIAENTGVLKQELWKQGKTVHIISPKSIKKYATGTGNADKNLMYESFVKETSLELTSVMNYNKIPMKMSSPVSDLVDSYYICKNLYEQLTF